jgi:type I restriction enzyme S subunit
VAVIEYPSDWECLSIEELYEYKSTIALSRAELKANDQIGYIHYGDIHTKYDRKINLKSASLPTVNPSQIANATFLNNMDLVLADASEDYVGVGKTIEVTGATDNKTVAGLHTILLRPKTKKIVEGFGGLIQFIPVFRDQIQTLASGLKVYGISKSNLSKIKIFLPPEKEQKAIAKVLSDIDELIAGFKMEIEKNENIKTGLVQKNLNPLVPNSKLRDHATMASGGTPLTSVSTYYGGEIPWVSITDMTDSGKYIERTARNLTESGLLNSSAVIYPINTLLFAMYASIGKCALPKVPVTSSQAILGITVKPSLNIDYLYYILTSRTQEFISMGQQGTQSNLNKIIVGDFNIPVPPLKDQEKIAAEFINIDLKMDALKYELAKYECIKQGMAHDLLTGKVRLV